MEKLSRRSMLRLAGGAAGASGLAGASLLSGPGLLAPTFSAPGRKIRATLNQKSYRPGKRMRLHIQEDLRSRRRDLQVRDSSGTRWRRVRKARNRQVWTARAPRSGGAGTVTVVTTRAGGTVVRDRAYRDRVGYQVVGGNEAALASAGTIIGMSAPSRLWDQRVREVGEGVGSRRIFADLARGANSQMKSIERAHADGMLPVISYKVGGDINGAIAGRFNDVAEEAAAELDSFGLPTAVSFWHEPNPDISGADYAAASRQLLPIFKRGDLRVGPILNGWLLGRNESTFTEYCPDELFEIWDWVGADTYESGSKNSPGKSKPAEKIYALADYVTSRGYDLPLGIGEYNGFSAETIADAGEALLDIPNMWFGCVWNSTGERFNPLEGDRLAAFRETLRDPRNAASDD